MKKFNFDKAPVGAGVIAPHIPDNPTEAGVLALLEHMDYGVCYYQQGPPTLLPKEMPPGGESFALVPVMCIHWRGTRDLDTATLYIDGRPYTFPSKWMHKKIGEHYSKLHKRKPILLGNGD